MDTESDKYGRNILQQNIRDLLDSSLPAQISQLEESTSRLEHLAAYCEANYLQVLNNFLNFLLKFFLFLVTK